MELRSCFISDPDIVHTSKKVLIYAEGIAKEYNLLASDLILAAVWHCLNQANKTLSEQETCKKHPSDRISDIKDDVEKFKNKEIYAKEQGSLRLDTGQQNLDKESCRLTKEAVEHEVEVNDMCKEKNSQVPKHSDSAVDKQTEKLHERSSVSISCQENTDDLKNEKCNDRQYSESRFSSAEAEENVLAENLGESYKSGLKETGRQAVSEKENIRKSQTQGSSEQLNDAQTIKLQASIVKEERSHSKTERKKVGEFTTDVEVISLDDEDSNNFCNGSRGATVVYVETVVSTGKVEESEPDYFDMDCDEIDDEAEYEEMLNTTDESATERSPRKQVKEDCDGNQGLCVNDSDITIISDDEDDCEKNLKNKENESSVTDQLSEQSTSFDKSRAKQERTPSKRKQAHSNIIVDFLDRSVKKEEENVVKDTAVKNVQVSKEQSSSFDSSELSCMTAVLRLDRVDNIKFEDSSGPEMPPECSHIPKSETESPSPSPSQSSSSLQCLDTVKSPPRKKRLLDYDKKWHMEPKYSPEQDKVQNESSFSGENREKKRKHYNIDEKLRIVMRVRKGEMQTSVARDLGIPESTLRGWLKDESKIREHLIKFGNSVREMKKYLALPGGIDGNPGMSDWRQPGKYNSISQFSSSQQGGFEKAYSDYIHFPSVADDSYVDDEEQDSNDDTDYDVSKEDSFSNSSDEDNKRKHGRKPVTRGRPRGRPRLHGSRAIVGIGRGLKKETKQSRGLVRGVRGKPRGRTALRGSLGHRGGTRTRNVSDNEFSSKSDQKEKSSPKLSSLIKGLSFKSRGRRLGFYSLKVRKPRLQVTTDNAAKLGSQGVVKRGRGRPRNHVLYSNMDRGRDKPSTSTSVEQPVKRGRGRPRYVRGVGSRGRAGSKPPEEKIRKNEELEDVIIID